MFAAVLHAAGGRVCERVIPCGPVQPDLCHQGDQEAPQEEDSQVQQSDRCHLSHREAVYEADEASYLERLR